MLNTRKLYERLMYSYFIYASCLHLYQVIIRFTTLQASAFRIHIIFILYQLLIRSSLYIGLPVCCWIHYSITFSVSKKSFLFNNSILFTL